MPEKADPARIDEGLRLSKARRLAGLEQQDVAERLRLSIRTVSRWERGRSAVHPAMRTRLAALLQVQESAIWRPVSGGVVSRETPPDGFLEGARWGYVRAARELQSQAAELLDRALADAFPPLAQPAPPITAAKIAKEAPPPPKPARRARPG